MEGRLQRLMENLPEGVPVPFQWLKESGLSSALAAHYVKAGWLGRLPGGAYWRPLPELDWVAAVYAAQQLGLPLHVGQLTALSLHGLSHYQLMQAPAVQTYPVGRVPGWLSGLPVKWDWQRAQLFREALPPVSTLPTSLRVPQARPPVAARLGVERFTERRHPLYISTPERAALELAATLTTGGSWDTAYETFSGLTMLRPALLRSLLLACRKVVVKRVFLHLAAQSSHSWLAHLDLKGIDLGKGDRQVVAGGTLDLVYRITVPKPAEDHDF